LEGLRKNTKYLDENDGERNWDNLKNRQWRFEFGGHLMVFRLSFETGSFRI
jgi:hypothetical protein